MNNSDSITVHDEQAAEYDQQVREYRWFGPEIVFGMCFGYVNPQDRLRDIGIGTGLGALPFAKTGLKIFGIDGSGEMLKICKSNPVGYSVSLFSRRPRKKQKRRSARTPKGIRKSKAIGTH